ncbi:MAG: hypothetical protein MK008_02125 [Bdellovibrionales bacterium]|nr:hypothetical protein [Bdellovibrionales bacterium]
MILLFIISTVFADMNIYKRLQVIYTQQQTPLAYSVLLNCTTSIQQKHLSETCWQDFKKLSPSKNKEKIKAFFNNQCANFEYSLKQMAELKCPSSIISKQRIHDYKKNDIYIDN